MKVLTTNQKAVLAILRYSAMPLTVREIAQSCHRPDGTVRAALASLDRSGAVERLGVSLSGGATWSILGRAAKGNDSEQPS